MLHLGREHGEQITKKISEIFLAVGDGRSRRGGRGGLLYAVAFINPL